MPIILTIQNPTNLSFFLLSVFFGISLFFFLSAFFVLEIAVSFSFLSFKSSRLPFPLVCSSDLPRCFISRPVREKVITEQTCTVYMEIREKSCDIGMEPAISEMMSNFFRTIEPQIYITSYTSRNTVRTQIEASLLQFCYLAVIKPTKGRVRIACFSLIITSLYVSAGGHVVQYFSSSVADLNFDKYTIST